jgi:SAM-dependent methyltransferase
VDHSPHDGVDYVCDVEREPLPFANGSVSNVFSSHCLEHLRDPERFFREIGRVCEDGAEVEIWTPYAFSNGAFIFSHVQFLNEDHYAHMCILFPDAYRSMTGVYWEWTSITYVLMPSTIVELDRAGISFDFGVKYLKNVVLEFGVTLNVRKKSHRPIHPERRFALDRNGARYHIPEARPVAEADVAAVLRKWTT